MPGENCTDHPWITEALSIAIQVSFIFGFLTVFFFAYVQDVEKNEFKNQLEIVVDSIYNDMIPQKQSIDKKTSVVVSGLIDYIEENIKQNSQKVESDINNQNKSTKYKAFKLLVAVIILIVAISSIILLLGFCVQIGTHVKEAMLVVIFVGITEFAFLMIIAKNYISADPNRVKRNIADNIMSWIKKNYPNQIK